MVAVLVYAYYSLRNSRAKHDQEEAEIADMELRAFPMSGTATSSPVKIFPESRPQFDSELGERARQVLMKYYGEQMQLQHGGKEKEGDRSPRRERPEKLVSGVNPMAKQKAGDV